MEKQNYQNHRKLKPDGRFQILYYVSVISLNLLAITNLIHSICTTNGRLNALLFMLTGLSLLFAYFLFRSFSLKAQDRSIRVEENLRHFVLTGKQLDKNLTISQIIALRFASDQELVTLAARSVKENLSNDAIKKSIINWKEDTYRV
jgi:hypothetical protein